MGFHEHYYCIESVGKLGGLALFWKEGVELEKICGDKNVAVSVIYSEPPSVTWMHACFLLYMVSQASMVGLVFGV